MFVCMIRLFSEREVVEVSGAYFETMCVRESSQESNSMFVL